MFLSTKICLCNLSEESYRVTGRKENKSLIHSYFKIKACNTFLRIRGLKAISLSAFVTTLSILKRWLIHFNKIHQYFFFFLYEIVTPFFQKNRPCSQYPLFSHEVSCILTFKSYPLFPYLSLRLKTRK